MFKKILYKFVSIFPEGIQRLYFKYEEMLMYLLFGALTTAVSFVTAGISKALFEYVGLGTQPVSVLSTAVSWIFAVTFAYLTNRVWVFSSKASGAKEIIAEAMSFYGGRVFTFFLEIFIMWLGYSKLGFNYWITKIGANVLVLILNYVFSKIFVFRKKNKEASQ